MPLSAVLVTLLGLTLVWALPAWLAASASLPRQQAPVWAADTLATLLLALLTLAMVLRSPSFGIDTPTYIEAFSHYCLNVEPARHDLSFELAHALMNVLMLGACRPGWLPAAWMGVVLVAVACTSPSVTPRARLWSLFLFSFVGIELLTNAMRQGMALAVFVAGLSQWKRRRHLSAVLIGVALLLHDSMILALFAMLLCLLPWRLFLPALLAAVGGTMYALQFNLELLMLEPLLFEIRKYLGHESDELLIRLLSFGTLMAAALCPSLVAQRGTRRTVWDSAPQQRALRLVVTCLPFLAIPWFGYRYIYAIYPIVLFITITRMHDHQSAARHYFLVLGLNAAVLLVWSLGSSLMRETPFLQ